MAERFLKVFKNKIPKAIYGVALEAGEETGLIVKLISDDCIKVILDFGMVQSFRMIDEGLLLNYHKHFFENKETKEQMKELKKRKI